MNTIQKIACFFLLLLPLFIRAENKEVPFTLDDRDRIIRTEQKVEAVNAKIDMKVDGLRSEMNARFEQLFNFLWAIIGIFTTMMISVFGLTLWDRKITIAPLKREDEKLKIALREFSRTQPKLAEILRNAGML